MPQNIPTIKINTWQGLDNLNEPHEVGMGLTDAVNVEFTRNGKVARRRGAHRIYSGAVDALWSDGVGDALFLSGNELKSIDVETRQVTTLQTGLIESNLLAALRIQNRLFWSNGINTGCIDFGIPRTWGLEMPNTRPLITHTSGNLFPGTYLVAVSFLRNNGEESGVNVAAAYELKQPGGLIIGEIPISKDKTVSKKNIYCSSSNGEELYLVETIKNHENTVVLPEFETGRPLETQFKLPPPPCHDIALFKGAVYVATGNMLLVSEPYNYELFDPINYIQFATPIRCMGTVSDGIWIGTDDEIVFLQGATIDSFNLMKRANHGAIQGSLAYSNASAVGQNGERMPDQSVVFATTEGIMAGFPGGELRNLTQRKFKPQNGFKGAAIVQDGYSYTLCYRASINSSTQISQFSNLS